MFADIRRRDEEVTDWNEGQWLFPRAVRILEISAYRKPVLRGLVLSVGSKTDSTVNLSFPITLLLLLTDGIYSNALSPQVSQNSQARCRLFPSMPGSSICSPSPRNSWL